MSYFGKEFTLASQENFAELVSTWDVPEAFKEKIISAKPSLKLEKNGDSYTYYSTSIRTGTLEPKNFRLGVEFDEKNEKGLLTKNVVTLEGDTFTHKITSDGKWVVFKLECSANEVVVTITSSNYDGVAKRIFKAA